MLSVKKVQGEGVGIESVALSPRTPSSRDYDLIYQYRDGISAFFGEDESKPAAEKILLEPDWRVSLPTQVLVKVGYSSSIPCYEYLPPDKDPQTLNTLFYLPGTASRNVLFKPENAVCTRLAMTLQCRVIGVFHRVAPEAAYPIPFNDVCQAINYYLYDTDIPINHIAIGGYSSGGLLALQIALQATHLELPIVRLLLIAPVVNLAGTFNLEVREHDPTSPEFFRAFLRIYLPSHVALDSPEASPFHASTELLTRLPPIILAVGTEDILYPTITEFCSKLGSRAHDVFIPIPGKNHRVGWREFAYLNRKTSEDFYLPHVAEKELPRVSRVRLKTIEMQDATCWGVTQRFNLHTYIDRISVQDAIEEFFSIERGDVSIILNLLGSSGSGKSQIALNYYYHTSHRYSAKYWFNASNIETLEGEYFLLGSQQHLFYEKMSGEEKIIAVREWLESRSNILVVYDGALSSEGFYFPRKKCHVLMTSVELLAGEGLPVQRLEPEEKQRLWMITARSVGAEIEMSHEVSGLLAEIDSPVALHQACYYYYKVMKNDYSQLMDRYHFMRDRFPTSDSTEIFIRLVMDSFREELLTVSLCFAVLSNLSIPVAFFIEEDSLIEELSGQFILMTNHAENSLFIHAIFQEVFFKILLEQDKIILIVNNVLERIHGFSQKHQSSRYVGKNYGNLQVIFPHILGLLKIIAEHSLEKLVNQELLAYLYCSLARVQNTYSRAKEAEDSLAHAISYYQIVPPDPLFQRECLLIKSAFYWEQGRLREGLLATNAYCELSEEYCELFGAFRFASALHNLSSYYNRLGNYDAAETTMRKAIAVLDTLEKTPENTKQKAMTHIIFGFLLSSKQKYSEALACMKVAETSFLASGMSFHDSDIYLRFGHECLGTIFYGQGERKKAAAHFKLSLVAREAAFGAKDRLVALTSSKLALAQDDLEKCINYFNSALQLLFSHYPDQENIYIAECYSDIAKAMVRFNKIALVKLFSLAALRGYQLFFSGDAELYEGSGLVIAIKKLLVENCDVPPDAIESELASPAMATLDRDELRQSLLKINREPFVTPTIGACRAAFFMGVIVGANLERQRVSRFARDRSEKRSLSK